MNVHIIGCGNVPLDPQRAVSNDEVFRRILNNPITTSEDREKVALLTSEKTAEKIGIRSRQYFTNPDDGFDPANLFSYDLALIAARNAIESARQRDKHFSVNQLQLVLCSGSSSNNLYPGCSTFLQSQLGLPIIECGDGTDACCSFTHMLITAIRAMKTDGIVYAMVAMGETVGSLTNAFRNEDATLWGDGGAAFVLKLVDDDETGFLRYQSRANGAKAHTTLSRGQGSAPIHRGFGYLDNSMEGYGRDIQLYALRDIGPMLVRFCEESTYDPDTAIFNPHNSNLPMITNLGKQIGIPPERVIHLLGDHANQSSVGAASTYAHYYGLGELAPGTDIITATIGSGLKWDFLHYRQQGG